MDYVGAGLLLLAVAAPLFTLDLGGQVLPWGHPVMILLYILTPVLVVLFFSSQSRCRGYPLVPLRFLRKKSVVAVFACGLPAWLSWDQVSNLILLARLPLTSLKLKYGLGQYVQARSMSSPSTSTFSDWALSCVFLGIPLGSFISGIIIRKYRALKLLLRTVAVINLLTYICFAAGWIRMSMFNRCREWLLTALFADPEHPAFAPVLLLVGLNVGVLDSCWLVSIFSQASPEGKTEHPIVKWYTEVDSADQPTLYAFFDLGRANTGNFGIAVALASTNAMIRSNLQSALTNYPNKEDVWKSSGSDHRSDSYRMLTLLL